jgi:hypothetical protein
MTISRERTAVLGPQLTAADLDREGLLALLKSTDPLGVLSIYVDAGSGASDGRIDVSNRLNQLQRRIGVEGTRAQARALGDAVLRLQPTVARLFAPDAPGRGRALFAALSRPAVTSFSSQLRLPNRVVLDTSPFIHPLLELLDEGRPAGVFVLSLHRVDVFDWRQGELRRVTQITLDETPARQRPGPVAPSAGRAQQTTPAREQRQRRARYQRLRFVEHAARVVAHLADARDWERVLVTGDERLTTPLVDALPESLREDALCDARSLDTSDPAKLAATISQRLVRQHIERETQLTRRVRDAAMSGAGGALGLSEVLAALNEARVSHLVYDPRIRFAGAVGQDGRMSTQLEQPPAAEGVWPEPRLTERIVERCLATGAQITPVEGAASAVLADAGGVAALLRW